MDHVAAYNLVLYWNDGILIELQILQYSILQLIESEQATHGSVCYQSYAEPLFLYYRL